MGRNKHVKTEYLCSWELKEASDIGGGGGGAGWVFVAEGGKLTAVGGGGSKGEDQEKECCRRLKAAGDSCPRQCVDNEQVKSF